MSGGPAGGWPVPIPDTEVVTGLDPEPGNRLMVGVNAWTRLPGTDVEVLHFGDMAIAVHYRRVGAADTPELATAQREVGALAATTKRARGSYVDGGGRIRTGTCYDLTNGHATLVLDDDGQPRTIDDGGHQVYIPANRIRWES